MVSFSFGVVLEHLGVADLETDGLAESSSTCKFLTMLIDSCPPTCFDICEP